MLETRHLLLGILLVSSGGALEARDNQEDSSLAFAFSDRRGTRLIALDPVAEPDKIAQALCDGSTVLAVKFLHPQTRTERDTGRAVAQNFDHYEGAPFAVLKGAADPESTCLLVSKEFLASRSLLRVTSLDYRAAMRRVCKGSPLPGAGVYPDAGRWKALTL